MISNQHLSDTNIVPSNGGAFWSEYKVPIIVTGSVLTGGLGYYFYKKKKRGLSDNWSVKKRTKWVGGNSGYVGYSMSRRAAEAYDNGEKPLSKWVKSDFENMPFFNNKMTLKECKYVYLEYAGWHHTSKFGNKTNFYKLKDAEEITDEYSDAKTFLEFVSEKRKEAKNKEKEKAEQYADISMFFEDELWKADPELMIKLCLIKREELIDAYSKNHSSIIWNKWTDLERQLKRYLVYSNDEKLKKDFGVVEKNKRSNK